MEQSRESMELATGIKSGLKIRQPIAKNTGVIHGPYREAYGLWGGVFVRHGGFEAGAGPVGSS